MRLLLAALLLATALSGLDAASPDIDVTRVGVRRRRQRTGGSEDADEYTAALPLSRPALYRPERDPRDFYQSEVYLREARERKDSARAQMSGVYPALAAEHARAQAALAARVRASAAMRSLGASGRYREWNSVEDDEGAAEACVQCPAEVTLVARSGAAEAPLPAPRPRGCAGLPAPRGVRFVRRYGPAPGSLVPAGEHVLIGALHHRGRHVRECRWRVHVIGQRCTLPAALQAHCGGALCNLTCANPALQLLGARQLICGSDLRWSGPLPTCRIRSWCHSPLPPDNGELSCQSASAGGGGGGGGDASRMRMSEGSRCRARCEPGRRASPRGAAVCRRGRWTHALTCPPRLSRHKLQPLNV